MLSFRAALVREARTTVIPVRVHGRDYLPPILELLVVTRTR